MTGYLRNELVGKHNRCWRQLVWPYIKKILNFVFGHVV